MTMGSRVTVGLLAIAACSSAPGVATAPGTGDACECARLRSALEQVPALSVAWTNWSNVDTIRYRPVAGVECPAFELVGRIRTDGATGPSGVAHDYSIRVVEGDPQPPSGYSTAHLLEMSQLHARNPEVLELIVRGDDGLPDSTDLALFEIGTNQQLTYRTGDTCAVVGAATGRY